MGTGSNKFWLWVLTGVLTLVLVVVLNLALTPVRMFWDLTKDQRFTLPDAARNVAASVDDTLRMTLYLSEDLPGGFKHLPRVLSARLDEFREASEGRIEYEFVDPKGDDELIAELKTRKIEPVQGQDRTEGKISIGQYWLWLVMRYGDQESQVNLAELGGQILQSEEALSSVLPYFISSRIVKLQNPDTKIGVVSEKKMIPAQILQGVRGLAELYGQNPTDGITSFRKQIESHYPALQDVSLKNGAPVPDGIQTLLVYRPENLSPREIYEIDHFLMKGKRVVVLLDNFPFFEIDKLQEWSQGKQQGAIAVRELDPALGEWLAHYGVMVEPGYVADDANAKLRQAETQQQPVQGPGGRPMMINVPTGRMLETDIPGYIVVRELGAEQEATGQFAADSPVVAGLGMVSMIYPAPLLVDPAWRQRQPEAELDVLLETSSQAWVNEVKDGTVPLAGGHADADTARGTRPLLIHLHGILESYFADREVPVKTAPDGRELPAGPGDASRAKFAKSEGVGHLMVFADSDFLQDLMPSLTRDAQEAAMGVAKMQVGFVNALDSITLGDDLVQIRRPVLTDLSVRQKDVDEDRGEILWWTVWFAPVVLIVLGLLWLIARGAATRVASPARIARVSDFGPGASGSSATAAATSNDETDQEDRS